METEEKKKSYRWVGILIAVLLVVGYGTGVWYFSENTYPRTTVNAEKAGNRPIETFYLRDASDRIYTFKGPNHTLQLSAKDIEGKWTLTSPVPEQPSAWMWPMEVFQSHDYTLEYQPEYDDALLEERIKEAGFDPNGPAPKDAEIVVDAEGARIQPEEPGNRVNLEEMKKLVLDTLGGDTLEKDASVVFEKPTVTKEDSELVKNLSEINELLDASITIPIGSEDYVLGPEQIYERLEKDQNGDYTLPEEAIEDFVVEIAKETDTYGTSREFETTGAGMVNVPPGIYGWQINVAETTQKISDLLEEGGVHEDVEPVYNHEGMARGDLNDIGDTYIELDLSRQHLWAYEDDELLFDADVKTGMVNHYNETPRGVNMIWSRETNQQLEGNTKDGNPYSSHVDYWMPINYGGVGLHDASWVSVFGGDEYLYNGSNGCINLNHETAEAIYENFSVGTPVVVYESSTNYSEPDSTY